MSLKEEWELILKTTLTRQQDAAKVIDALLSKKAAEKPDGDDADNSYGEPAVRFQNIESKIWIVDSPFTIDIVEFRPTNELITRPINDTQIELENQTTGQRVWVKPDVWDKIRDKHLREKFAGDFDFAGSLPTDTV